MFKRILFISTLILTSWSISGTAGAADLGGDCCADLEERVATLEATTARKGNRKVSLTISGAVYTQLLVWDDGIDSDAYVGSNLNDAGSWIDFAGSAKIDSHWSAGYEIKIHLGQTSAFLQSATDDDAAEGLTLDKSYLWIKHEQLGKISIGLLSQATDNIGIPGFDGLGSILSANAVTFEGASFNLIVKGSGVRSAAVWQDVFWCEGVGAGIHNDCHGARNDAILYESPTIAGFTLSASWGEDDFYDVALRHFGNFGDFQTYFGVGFSDTDDVAVADTEFFQISGAFLHKPTGLFANGVYGIEDTDDGRPETDTWYVKAGIKQRWNSWGHTILYGEYGASDDGFNTGDADRVTAGVQTLGTILGIGTVTGSEFERYGVGIVQDIDAASMSLWVKWKHFEGDIDGTTGSVELEELDTFGIGGLITF